MLESVKSGVTIKRIENYLNEYYTRLNDDNKEVTKHVFRNALIPKNDFMEELRKLRRVTVGQVYIEKQWLGSEYLNLSDNLEDVKNDIIVDIRAEPRRSIESVAEDIYRKFTASESRISRVRFYGLNEFDQRIPIDTKIMQQIEHLDFETDPLTGTIRTHEILTRMVQIAREL